MEYLGTIFFFSQESVVSLTNSDSFVRGERKEGKVSDASASADDSDCMGSWHPAAVLCDCHHQAALRDSMEEGVRVSAPCFKGPTVSGVQ